MTKCRGCSISVKGMEIVWGMLWLRDWEVGNEGGMRVGDIEPKTKN